MTESTRFTTDVTIAIYQTVGQLAVHWSLMEFSIDALNSILYHDFGGKELDPMLQQELSRKLRFMRKCFTDVTALAPLRPNMIALLDRLAGMTDYRHDVIHGYLSQFEPGTGLITFISLKRNPDRTIYVVHERKVTAMKLLEIGVQASEIGHDLNQITRGLIAMTEGHKDLDDLLRKL